MGNVPLIGSQDPIKILQVQDDRYQWRAIQGSLAVISAVSVWLSGYLLDSLRVAVFTVKEMRMKKKNDKSCGKENLMLLVNQESFAMHGKWK